MTTPYGVTLRTAQQYIVNDYLRSPEHIHLFGRGLKDQNRASRVLMTHLWPAIGDVVLKGRVALSWMKSGARKMLSGLDPTKDQILTWKTPSGFPAYQTYYQAKIIRIKTQLHGEVRLKALVETKDPDRNKHANGFAPNFVHSMDASHVHLTAAACKRAGIDSLAMIHDDFGTHAADTQALYRILREEFVKMYTENDVIGDLVAQYPEMEEPPNRGTLDLNGVISSEFFFS